MKLINDIIWMKQIMFTKEVKEPTVELNNEDKDGEGVADADMPETSKDVEYSNIDEESEDESHEDVPDKDEEPWIDVTTCSGRSVRVPSRMIAEVGASALRLPKAEENYYALLDQGEADEFDPEELICVVPALVGGFQNTQELRVNKHKEALKGPDEDKWKEYLFEEHERMVKNQLWRAVPKKDVPNHSKILSFTWTLKKISDGTYHVRLNAR
jgi:hypothetical protein